MKQQDLAGTGRPAEARGGSGDGGGATAAAPGDPVDRGHPGDVAIIGMAGRFPGAPDVESLWQALIAGREGITFWSAEELIAAGVDPDLVARPDYVRAKGVLGGVDLFDAEFFGLNPREVELMDPQHRLFLECAWEALEDAGWDAERFGGLIGVYGGESMNTYLLMNLAPHLELVASADTLQASLGNDKDPLTARVSYKLNLHGPSITIQSASSTSLVAVHSACQALLNRDCDMALAGGVSIHLPETSGYLFQEGGTVSRDGHCRAFDADASGFVSGHGCGVVVLRRLAEAVADGDHVYAVIKGTACNNDGSHKVSFMAPSIDGQARLYDLAYANAGVDPATVGYVECHGTGTTIGDPIEIGALRRVFAAHTERRGFCAIGSLKTNLGHLDTAAGVCGLIKAVLALHHRTLPPSLHCRSPNPLLGLDDSPFFVNTELRPWPQPAGGGQRRAGVTSLGMGGTNAHVVIEEAPVAAATAIAPVATGPGTVRDPPGPDGSDGSDGPDGPDGSPGSDIAGGAPGQAPPPLVSHRPWRLLLLSAKTATALARSTTRLAEHLRHHPELQPADVAYTLQVGRRAFRHRCAWLWTGEAAAGTAGTAALLAPERAWSHAPQPGEHPVAFLFPGQGAQYPDMGRGLYNSEPVFREAVDRCCELLPFDLLAALYGSRGAAGGGGMEDGSAGAHLQRTEIAQPALFVISWATACLWLAWGIRPSALLGHSVGEIVAACLAGVFSLEDAVALVAERGRLMQRMAPGAMAALPLPEAEVRTWIEAEGSGLSLAAVNRPDLCVVSGTPDVVTAFADGLARRGIATRRIHTSHAFHSPSADQVLEPFAAAVRRARPVPPRIPLLSNLTGQWLRPEEATDAGYWARQLRHTVRFADGLARLLAEPQRILIEMGPGETLSSLAREHPAFLPSHAAVASLRHPRSATPDHEALGTAVAHFWLSGGEIDWTAFHDAERRRRVSLPTYAFERRRYWVEPPAAERALAARRQAAARREPRDWTYVPVWKQAPLPSLDPLAASAGGDELWLLLLDRPAAGAGGGRDNHAGDDGQDQVSGNGQGAGEEGRGGNGNGAGSGGAGVLGECLAARLAATGRPVVRAYAGEQFARLGITSWSLAPGRPADYRQLLAQLGRTPSHIVHLWSLGGAGSITANGASTGGASTGIVETGATDTGAGTAADGAESDAGDGLQMALDRSFYSLLFLAQAISQARASSAMMTTGGAAAIPTGVAPVSLVVVTGGFQEITGEEVLHPLEAAAIGPCLVLPRELPQLTCRLLDLVSPAGAQATAVAVVQILAESQLERVEPLVAFRRRQRFVRSFEPLPLDAAPPGGTPSLRHRGVCLITGGLGGMGLELAEHLVRQCAARLVLVGRSPVPPRAAWPAWLAGHAEDDPLSRRIRRLQRIEELGGEFLTLAADVADRRAMAEVVAAAERRFGSVDAVIHAAGVAGGGLARGRTREEARRVLAPKIDGALALAAAVAGRPLDFFVLTSSVTTALPPPGQLDYAAANAFLDAFAALLRRRGLPAVAIAWDAWRETGMAVAAAVPEELRAWREQNLQEGLASREGVEVFDRVLASGLTQVLVSTQPFHLRSEGQERFGDAIADRAVQHQAEPGGRAGSHPRPALANPFVAPRSDLDRKIAAVWQEVLGVEPIGQHDNFFELGGNSLAGLRVIGRLEERMQAGLSEISLYDAPTVEMLSRLIVAGRSGRDSTAPAEETAAAAGGATDSSTADGRSRGELRKSALHGRRRRGAERQDAEGR